VSRLLAATLLLGLLSTPALAYHTDEERFTDNTAHTLRSGEVRLGLWRVEWGVLDRLTVGTTTVPWLLKMPNLNLKWAFWQGDSFSAATRLGVGRLDMQNWSAEAPPSQLLIVPFELTGTYRFEGRHTLSAGLVYTWVEVSGSSPDSETLKGAAANSNTQLVGAWELRISKSTALVTEVRLLAGQTISGAVSSKVDNPPIHIELNMAGESDVADFKGAASIVPSIVWSWSWLNLRLGLGWGNLNVPVVNFVLPVKFVVPEMDLFARF